MLEQGQDGRICQKAGQKGALYIEATLCLSFFMFTIFTLLSVVQIAYTQSRVAVAMDSAAKELAEYTHVYYATGLAQTYNTGEGASSRIFNKVAEFLGDLGGDISAVHSDLGQFLTQAGSALAGDSIAQWLQTAAGKSLVKMLMEKNLGDGTPGSAETFMKRNHILSMDMNGSKFLEGGDADVFMRVNYEVQVVRLLNLDIKFRMSHCAYAKAWK